jgi:ribose transport system substrate-binding protein
MTATRRVALSALLGAGCRREKRRAIGVAPKATSHLFFVSIHEGVKKAAAEFGADVQWNGPQEETDYARQIQIVDAMIAQRVDAIRCDAGAGSGADRL